jgi:diacylglycerol O-acyltransferase
MTSALRPTAMDLTMHAMAQTRPSMSLTVGVVLHLDGAAPPLNGLRAHLAENLSRLPRLTYYLKGPRLRARWARDANPDLECRVRERRIEPGQASLDAALQDLVTQPLPDGPPWDLWLLHGHAPGTYVLCYRAHHTSHDGAGVFNTLYKLFGTSPAGATAVPAPKAGPRTYARTLKGMLSAAAVNNLWNDPAHPLHNDRLHTWVRVPTDTLRTTGAARGGSSNDAVLAALAGALRTWSSEHWPRGAGREVPAAMMVDLHRPQEDDLPGNLFTFAPVPLPCHQPTPAGRLDAVIAATREVRDPARRTAMRAITDRTPARAFHAVATRLTAPSRAIIDTSYIAIHQPLHYQKDPVTHLYAFTWLPYHHPVSITTISYNGTTTVHFVTDQALPGLDRLPVLWEQAATEAVPAP